MSTASAASVSNVLKGAVALVALVPGVALATGAIDLPVSELTLLRALSLCAGPLVVLAVFLGGDALARISNRALLIALALCFAMGTVSLIGYYKIGHSHLVEVPVDGGTDTHERVLVPLFPQGRLAEIIGRHEGSYFDAISEGAEGETVRDEIVRQRWQTVLALAILLLLSEILLLGSVVAGAWKVALNLDKAGVRPAEDTSAPASPAD